MGILRFGLALVVFLGHSSATWNLPISSMDAVRGFYVISGFLMAMVLADPTRYKTFRQFFLSRFLRLWPCFAVVTLLTLAARLIAGSIIITEAKTLGLPAILMVILANGTMLTSDLLCFFQWDTSPVLSWSSAEQSLVHFLMIPQAWTLGIELSFYGLAFFIIRNKYVFFLLLLLTIVSNLLVWYLYGFAIDPISYRFFPAELIYFFFGIILFYVNKYLSHFTPRAIFYFFITGFVIFLFFCCSHINVYQAPYLFPFTVSLMLPFLSKLDKMKFISFLGHVSFPFYLVHKLVIWAFILIFPSFNSLQLATFQFFVSFFVSIFMILFLISPLEPLRKRVLGFGF